MKPAVTIEVVDAYHSPEDQDATSPGDWQEEPVTDHQKAFAELLWIELPIQATKGQASDLISKGINRGDSGLATDAQRNEAELLGARCLTRRSRFANNRVLRRCASRPRLRPATC